MTTYYLDGYNVIHGSDALKRVAEKSIQSAREVLVKMVADYCTQSGQKVVVVFDGGGDAPRSAEFAGRVRNLSVVYCEDTISADAYIERAVFETNKRLDVVVVTADSTVAQLVRGLGALVLKPQSFIQQVQAAMSENRRRTARRKKQNSFGGGLAERLDEHSKAGLKALRDGLSAKSTFNQPRRRAKKGKAGPKTGS
jgi:predicted RNA-binding protein with PIN domain